MAAHFLKLQVLKELNQQESTGYQLIKILGEKGKRPSPGSIYPLLKELKCKGLVLSHQDSRKKIYSLTKKGKRRIEDLIREQKEILFRGLDILGGSKDITGEKIPLLNLKKKIEVTKNLEHWEELRRVALKLSMRDDFDSISSDIEKVTHQAVKKLREIDRK